ncbi:MAG TPA: hypothetical protein VKX46_03655 [Ktedonobacteraceae bacterium]|nr:hypothetical protein [Ktedonobacteraceae bacterium]
MKAVPLPKNIAYYVAGVGAIIALIAFFFVPFATEVISYNYTSQGTGVDSQKSAFTPQFVPRSASIIENASGNTTALAQANGVIWVNAVLTLVLIVAAVLLAFRSNPFGLRAVPADKQVRWGQYGMLGAAVLSILIQIGVFASVGQVLQSSLSSTQSQGSGGIFSSFTPTATVQYDTGAWIFLFGMIVVIVAIGLLLVEQLPAQLAAYRARAAQGVGGGMQYPAQQPYPSNVGNQYPGAQPYQQPTGDFYSGAQPYQGAANPYPPVQSYQPDASYPPAASPSQPGKTGDQDANTPHDYPQQPFP